MSLPLLGEEAYRQRAKKRIRFFYKGSEEELTPDKLQPGQRLSIAMGEEKRGGNTGYCTDDE